MVGAPAFMRGSSAFKPSGSRRTILLRLQPRGFQTFSPSRNRLNALPGVESAAAAYRLPIQVEDGLPFQIIGRSLNVGVARQGWYRFLGKSTMVGAPACMRGSSAFKPSGSRRTILLRLQPRGFQTFSPSRNRLNALPGVPPPTGCPSRWRTAYPARSLAARSRRAATAPSG